MIFSVEAFGIFDFLLDLARGPHHANIQFIAICEYFKRRRQEDPQKGKNEILWGAKMKIETITKVVLLVIIITYLKSSLYVVFHIFGVEFHLLIIFGL